MNVDKFLDGLRPTTLAALIVWAQSHMHTDGQDEFEYSALCDLMGAAQRAGSRNCGIGKFTAIYMDVAMPDVPNPQDAVAR